MFESVYGLALSDSPEDRLYNQERATVERIVRVFGRGHLADIGAGTGHWLAKYWPNVSRATLVEPSDGMRQHLRKSAIALGILPVVNIESGDHTSLAGRRFDSILLSSVLGHYDKRQQRSILETVSSYLETGGDLLILDSTWNDRAASLHPEKSGIVERAVGDRSMPLFKHYFDESEVLQLSKVASLEVIQANVGTYFWHLLLRKVV